MGITHSLFLASLSPSPSLSSPSFEVFVPYPPPSPQFFTPGMFV